MKKKNGLKLADFHRGYHMKIVENGLNLADCHRGYSMKNVEKRIKIS